MINNDTLLYFRIGITILLCLLGFIFQKSKILTVFQEFWIIILTCFNTYSVDWNANYGIYLDSNLYKNLLGWIMNLFKIKLNADFYLFNGVLSFISLLMVFYVVYKEASKTSLVLSLWLIFPFIDNIIQKRFFWGFGLTVCAIYCLLKINSKVWKIVIYELLILFANGIHNAYIIFLLLPFFLILSRKKQIIFAIILVFIGMVMHGQMLSLVAKVLPDLQNKSELYFGSMSSSGIAVIIWTMWQVLQLFFIYQLFKNNKSTFANLIISLNIFSLILIPFYTFDPVFTRCFRPILIFNYIGLSRKANIRFNDIEINFQKRQLFYILSYIAVVLFTLFVFDIWSKTSLGFDSMVKTIYINNSFLNSMIENHIYI